MAEDAVEGYSSAITGDAQGGFTVTNTSTATVSVPVEKKWVGPAADKATVRLLAGGQDAGKSVELSDANGWKASFEGLAKYDASGSEIEYTVAEDAVEGYDSAIAGDAHVGFTVTNTSTAKVDVPVERKWVGPAAGEVTVSLKRGDAVVGTMKLNAEGGWKGTFSGLPKYDAQTGEQIEYTVAEDAVEGYSSAITGDAQGGFTVTNTSTATVSVPVEKKWVGPAADKATVRLLAGGQDAGKSVELSDANGWKASFEGLAKYDASGSEIEYTVAEDAVEGYDSAIAGDAHVGFTVTNTSTAKVDVPVERKWVGPAAGEVTVSLKRGDAVVGTMKLNAEGGWKGTFSGLPKYDAQTGEQIEYAVAEDAVEGYSSAITGDAQGGFTVTNTSTATVSVPVEKKWVGPAADKATVRLLAGGQDAGKSVELSDANGWKASFEGLAKYDASGSEIEYTVAEDAVEGYDSAIAGDAHVGFTVTNTSTAKVDVPVEKKWVGPAAGEVTVSLKRGDAVVGTMKLNAEGGWKGTFSGLPKYDAQTGEQIEYAVAEDAVEGYSSADHRRRAGRLHRHRHLDGNRLGARREEVGRPGRRQGDRAPARRRPGRRQVGRAQRRQRLEGLLRGPGKVRRLRLGNRIHRGRGRGRGLRLRDRRRRPCRLHRDQHVRGGDWWPFVGRCWQWEHGQQWYGQQLGSHEHRRYRHCRGSGTCCNGVSLAGYSALGAWLYGIETSSQARLANNSKSA